MHELLWRLFLGKSETIRTFCMGDSCRLMLADFFTNKEINWKKSKAGLKPEICLGIQDLFLVKFRNSCFTSVICSSTNTVGLFWDRVLLYNLHFWTLSSSLTSSSKITGVAYTQSWHTHCCYTDKPSPPQGCLAIEASLWCSLVLPFTIHPVFSWETATQEITLEFCCFFF